MGNDSGKHLNQHNAPTEESLNVAVGHHLEQTLGKTFQKYARTDPVVEHAEDSLFLDLSAFEAIFKRCPGLGEYTYQQCMNQTSPVEGEREAPVISKEQFVKWALPIMRMTDWREKTDWVLSLFASENDITKTGASLIFRMSLLVEMASAGVPDNNVSASSVILAMEKSMFGTASTVDKSEFLHWSGRHCPRLLDGIHGHVSGHVSSNLCSNSEDLQAVAQTSVEHSATDDVLLSIPILWATNTYMPSIFTVVATTSSTSLSAADGKSNIRNVLNNDGGWQLLYCSRNQGLSINRFQHHVMSYSAPTLSLIQFEGHLYCVGCDEQWCDKSTRWGGSNCFLLQIFPQFRVMQAGANMLYFNTGDRKCPKGLQVGKDPRTTLLQIDEDFAHVKHYGIGIPLQDIEVWGCGSISALEKQKEQVKWETKMTQKSKDRKLKLEDWKDNPDRQLLEYGGVTTEHAER